MALSPAMTDPIETEAIEAYLLRQRKLGRSPRTVADREQLLWRAVHDMPHGLLRANADEVFDWVFREHLCQQSKATYLAGFRSFFRFATDPRHPIISVDPTTLVDSPRLPRRTPRPVSQSELARMLLAAPPYGLWARLAAYAGLRCVEISRLDREHIDQAWIWVQGKGDVHRFVPTDADLWRLLRDLPPGPVAIQRDGQRASPQHVSITAANHFRRNMHMPGVCLHRARHWFGTAALRAAGGNLRTVQQLMGHASPTTTAVYTAIASEQLSAAVCGLPRVS